MTSPISTQESLRLLSSVVAAVRHQAIVRRPTRPSQAIANFKRHCARACKRSGSPEPSKKNPAIAGFFDLAQTGIRACCPSEMAKLLLGSALSSPTLMQVPRRLRTPSWLLPSSRVLQPSLPVLLPSSQVLLPSSPVLPPSSQVLLPSSQVLPPSSQALPPSSQVLQPSSQVLQPSSQALLPSWPVPPSWRGPCALSVVLRPERPSSQLP